MSKLEIAPMLVLSTAHLTRETSDWLESIDWVKEGPAGGPYLDYGFFSYVHDDNACFPSAPHAPEGEFPADLWAIYEFACARGCSYVLIDRDADTIDGLAIHQ